MIQRFTNEMENVQKIARKKIVWRGLLNSSLQVFPHFVWGYSFWYGGYLVANEEIHYKDVVR